MIIEIKEGKELTKAEINFINRKRKIELGSKSEIIISPENENWTKKFFLVKKKDEIMAFGRFHEAEIEFHDKLYSVLGIAGIVAVQKGKGYGKVLVSTMIKYAQKDGRSILGFCETKVSGFYEKCGFTIIKGNDRFLYKDSNGLLHKKDSQGDIIYIKGKDELISKLLDYPLESVLILRPHW